MALSFMDFIRNLPATDLSQMPPAHTPGVPAWTAALAAQHPKPEPLPANMPQATSLGAGVNALSTWWRAIKPTGI